MPNIGDSRSSSVESTYRPRDCYNPDGKPKITFRTKSQAKNALKKMTHRINGVPIQRKAQIYRCSQCSMYHLGHKK
jgi:hypothetical protein